MRKSLHIDIELICVYNDLFRLTMYLFMFTLKCCIRTLEFFLLQFCGNVRQRSDYQIAAHPKDGEGDFRGGRMSFGHSLSRQKVSTGCF